VVAFLRARLEEISAGARPAIANVISNPGEETGRTSRELSRGHSTPLLLAAGAKVIRP